MDKLKDAITSAIASEGIEDTVEERPDAHEVSTDE